jgi:hypothetical protein
MTHVQIELQVGYSFSSNAGNSLYRAATTDKDNILRISVKQ